MSVARCYVVKNRQQEVVPYDRNRVELPTTKDDYINASHVRDLTEHAPRAIATQAPLARTFGDFWTMVAQEQVETVVCLLSPDEMVSQKPYSSQNPISLNICPYRTTSTGRTTARPRLCLPSARSPCKERGRRAAASSEEEEEETEEASPGRSRAPPHLAGRRGRSQSGRRTPTSAGWPYTCSSTGGARWIINRLFEQAKYHFPPFSIH